MATTKNHGRMWRLCQKELKETIRDRRTITTLLLMPLLVYPLLSMALNRFLLTAASDPSGQVAYTIGVASDREGMQLSEWLQDPRSRPPEAVLNASDGGLAKFEVFNTEQEHPREALEKNKIDIACEIDFGEEAEMVPPNVKFIAFNGDAASQNSQRIMVERLQWLSKSIAEEIAANSPTGFQPPAVVSVEDVGEVQSPSMLGTIVPLVLVLMTITGAVYPAIDLTAGERERGTMESLMASPVPRWHVLFAKYTAVVTVALLTAMANLLAMFTTLWASGLLGLLTGDDTGFPWLPVLQILGLLVLFSGFFSAVLLSLTSFAKSFKEAQAYLIPVMLLSLTPGMLSLMPGVKLSGPLAIAPLVNIVVLARDVLQGNVNPAAAAIAVISTCAYAAAALGVASMLFGSDAVMRTSQQSIASLFRRSEVSRAVPTPQTAAMMMALLVPIYFIVSNVLMRVVADLSVPSKLMFNAISLAATFGLVPLAAAWLSRSRLQTTFRITTPRVGAIIGALLVGLGAWGIALESYIVADQLGIAGLDSERIQRGLKTLDLFRNSSPVLLVITLALTPAVIEELCFRGFLFSALSKSLRPWPTIFLTALLFGLFHVVTGNVLLLERFVPTTLLGLVLGWIAYRTGSVLPGMLMHFVHNALVEVVAHYHKELAFLGEGFDGHSHLPISWLATATGIAIAGCLVIAFSGTRISPTNTDHSSLDFPNR
ncbi:ABC transporter permease subunit/CPBP intramembrane protease [Stieleria varia]|uniref:ABC-2 family transporter protein n=1 Tax=Stieleria varia TaxID=2528005 RepID=A0A5C6ANP3_9BACT|nr:ABC transporter permease subunit/CPBP intramembrane protease [Stieleria varia]TWU01127.1 ABC-2 family transporter protein [Stieleria varia]